MSEDLSKAPEADALPAAREVTLAEVQHVAALASLQLTAEEQPRMQRDLNAVLNYIAALDRLDTTGVPAMAQVSELLSAVPALSGATLRGDNPKPSVKRVAVMNEAPETDGRFFKVPKVIER